MNTVTKADNLMAVKNAKNRVINKLENFELIEWIKSVGISLTPKENKLKFALKINVPSEVAKEYVNENIEGIIGDTSLVPVQIKVKN